MEQRYQLLELIATGGMAEIFLARRVGPGGFEKLVVVKRPFGFLLEDPETEAMFLEEARLAADLHHGGIVQVFDLGVADSGEYFIVMEYVSGRDLGEVLEHPMVLGAGVPIRIALHVTRAVLRALEYAHRKSAPDGHPLGLIHRDISPQNVLVSFEGEVKLTDFGIARARTRQQFTQAGFLRGKYGYMSPEQARGRELDHRTDVYNVGILLYELLVGRRLFAGPDDRALMNRMRAPRPRAPSLLRPDVPPELDAVVLRALAPRRENRWSSAAEMDRALGGAAPEGTAGDLAALMVRLFGRARTVRTDPQQQRVISLVAPARHHPEAVSDAGAPTLTHTVDLDAPPEPAAVAPIPAPGRRGRALTLALAFLLPLIAVGLWRGLPAPGATGPAVAKAPPPEAILLLESTPPGARVTLDGEPLAVRTPVALATGPGAHRVSLRLADHEPWESELAVGEGRVTATRATLRPRSGTLIVKAPKGATVRVDGRKVGTGRVRLASIARGTHQVQVRRAGHLVWEREVKVGRRRVVRAELLPAASAARVRILAGEGAQASAESQTVPAGEPLVLRADRPQRVEVRAPGLPARELVVAPAPGEDVAIYLELMPGG